MDDKPAPRDTSGVQLPRHIAGLTDLLAALVAGTGALLAAIFQQAVKGFVPQAPGS